MPADPESVWNYGPITDFEYPADVEGSLRMFFANAGTQISDSDVKWLADLLRRFWSSEAFDEIFAEGPIHENDYRRACLQALKVLVAIDRTMTEARDPLRAWKQVSLALNLPSCRYLHLTEAGIGKQYGKTKMAISKSITRFLRLAELPVHQRGYNRIGL
jgi:hypothetical protein